MSKHDKTREKLLRRPPAADLRWDDLKAYLKYLGYKELKGSGSRRKFVHRVTKHLILCHEPHPSPEVDKGCINDVTSRLKEIGLLEEK